MPVATSRRLNTSQPLSIMSSPTMFVRVATGADTHIGAQSLKVQRLKFTVLTNNLAGDRDNWPP